MNFQVYKNDEGGFTYSLAGADLAGRAMSLLGAINAAVQHAVNTVELGAPWPAFTIEYAPPGT